MPRTIYPLPLMRELALSSVRETRPVALYTSGPAWEVVGPLLQLPEVWRAVPDEATEASFVEHARSIPSEAQVIYAVGGGLAVDAAKIAMRDRGLSLVCVPTALSVDAFLTPASGIRRDGCVFYLETGAPNMVILDYEVLAAAPSWVRAAGLGDVLSIATGLWDWEFAQREDHQAPGQEYQAWAAGIARHLLDEAIVIAEGAGRGDHAALARLLDLLALEVQLCNHIGHSRPEEGSEHIFAYSVENLTGHGLPHGDLVGPGIVGIAAAQGLDVAPLRHALEAGGARLHTIESSHVEQTISHLSEYAERHRLPFGIAHAMTADRQERALTAILN